LEYDDVLNKHREVIYKKRKDFLAILDWKLKIADRIKTPEEKKALEEKVKELGENFNSVAKFVSLRILDMLWMDHLENMEYLRDSVRLRAYGQQDPLVEYKNEGHKMFQGLLKTFEASVVNTIMKAQITSKEKAPVFSQISPTPPSSNKKPGRNDPCPCGAKHPDGRPIKYKHCHGKNL